MADGFGGRLRDLRIARGWTQQQLAEASSVTRGALSHLEAGRRKPFSDTAERLASALGVSVAELLEGRRAAPAELVGLVSELAPRERQQLADYGEYLLRRQRAREATGAVIGRGSRRRIVSRQRSK